MIIDDVTIKAKAGHGGRGNVSFNSNMDSLGPVGGSGGDGGSVFLEGVSNLNALDQFQFKKEIEAPDGGAGRTQFIDGKDGEDLILKVPIGTVIHNLITGFDEEITKVGQKVLITKGGRGGKGNFHFRSATNTSPTEFQPGLPGESFEIRLELKLIADVGFVGQPNAGKSSLLNILTNAKSKVANYPFTTLEPHLGVYYDLILADIPGLIEGASGGKGLGIKFLRHIERTTTIFHFISAEAENIVEEYKTIRQELENYSAKLGQKEEYILVSKTDMIDPKQLKKEITALKKINPKVVAFSIYDDDSLKEITKILSQLSDKKRTGA